jgi:hypothetical protein
MMESYDVGCANGIEDAERGRHWKKRQSDPDGLSRKWGRFLKEKCSVFLGSVCGHSWP